MVRAIVVDDDNDTVEVFTDYLKIKGIDVVGTGSNGKQAFELYQSPSILPHQIRNHGKIYLRQHIPSRKSEQICDTLCPQTSCKTSIQSGQSSL